MAYTDLTQVQSLFRNVTFSTESAVTSADVSQFITDAETFINARLKNYYDIDNIGPESEVMLATVAKYKVASIIKEVLELTSSNSSNINQRVTGSWDMIANKMLDEIAPPIDNCKGCFPRPVTPLPDTDLISVRPQKATLFAGSNATKTFTKSGNNW